MKDINRAEFIRQAALGGLGLSLSPGMLRSISPDNKKPNIILIQCDQWRAGLNKRSGYPLDITPFMDSLAQSGTWFDKAYCGSPSCVPSRASTWTGRWPTATGIKSNGNVPRNARFKVGMDEVIKANGYKMAAIGKMFHSYLGDHPERVDFFKGYGHLGMGHPSDPEVKKFNKFLHETSFYGHFKPAPFSYKMQQPYRMVSDAREWIGEQNSDTPFFMYLSMNEPHNPYQVSEPYYSMFSPEDLPPLEAGPDTIPEKGPKYEQLKELFDIGLDDLEKHLPRLRSNYLGMMRLIDDQVKRLVEYLKEQELYENTVLVFIADHGDYAGEYGLMKKGAGLPECLCRIPMFWHGAGIASRSDAHPAHVSTTDLFPTICEMLDVPLPAGVQGRSLWPMLSGQSYPEAEFESMISMQGMGGLNYDSLDELDPYKSGTLRKNTIKANECNSWTQSGVLRMVRKGEWKLVYDMQRRGELYHLPDDSAELNNLYGSPEHEGKQMELLEELLGWELRTQDPLPLPKRYVLKKDPRNYYAPYRDNGARS